MSRGVVLQLVKAVELLPNSVVATAPRQISPSNFILREYFGAESLTASATTVVDSKLDTGIADLGQGILDIDVTKLSDLTNWGRDEGQKLVLKLVPVMSAVANSLDDTVGFGGDA